jgi:anaerobic magnesium-protoporphyrin IX monomethyl ester cyclase
VRVALVNPAWSYQHSIYFGCREAHLPLELGYTGHRLEEGGHEVLLLDGQLSSRDNRQLADEVAAFAPEMTVVATAPTYLFWRCAPPELRCPALFLRELDGRGGKTVAVGPHGSVTPGAALRKLGVDVVVRGECEEAVAALAEVGPGDVPGTAWLDSGEVVINGVPAAARFVDAKPLIWPNE